MAKIQWRKGNGTILLGTILCVLGLFLMLGICETINLFQGAVIAQTRADVIADGSAAYGISYDNTLDAGKVSMMSSLLLASSADYDNPISMQIDYAALADNQVRVRVTTERDFWFRETGQEEFFRITKEAVSQLITP